MTGDLLKGVKFQSHMCTVNRLDIRTKHNTCIEASLHVFSHRLASLYMFSHRLASSYMLSLKFDLDFTVCGFHGFPSIFLSTML